MDHSLYRPEDFACDESYLRYYFRLNDKDIGYWEHWIRTHPEKLDVVMSADQLIGFLSLQLPEEEFQHEYDRFTKAMAKAALLESARVSARKGLETLPVNTRPPRRRRFAGFWLALASMLLVTGSAWFFEYHGGRATTATAAPGTTLTRDNTTPGTMDITLEEGTRVRLEPGAHLAWPKHFLPGRREVYLDGAASFIVSKNPRQPFFVYCHSLVVHVLGTGFLVIPGKQDNDIEVAVSSGKVEVYEKTATLPKGDFPQKAAAGVVLTPNQKVIYTPGTRSFQTTLVDRPMPLDTTAGAVFNQAGLGDVARSLQQLYGVEIEMEDEMMYNCRFSGRLDNMDLYTALSTLCQPLGMTWEIKETKILVRGAGCDTPPVK